MSTTSSLDGNYSPPSPDSLWVHDTDSPTSIYPDRPIHPLPKRRIRSRLSSATFDSIVRPQTIALSPYSRDRRGSARNAPNRERFRSNPDAQGDHGLSYQFKGHDTPPETCIKVSESSARSQYWREVASSSANMLRNCSLEASRQLPRYTKVPVPLSATSSAESVDGYDSFENTNNKKKRKIPISGSLGNYQGSLSADMAHINLSGEHEYNMSHTDSDHDVGQYDGSGSLAAATIPSVSTALGAAHGRHTRLPYRRHGGRSPLKLLSNGTNTSYTRRSIDMTYLDSSSLSGNDQRLLQILSSDQAVECFRPVNDQGIIATAIANAAIPSVTLSQGKENPGNLSTSTPKRPSPAKTQFTFTCESDTMDNTSWPGSAFPTIYDVCEDVPTGQNGTKSDKHDGRVSTQSDQGSGNIRDQGSQFQKSLDSLGPDPSQLPRKPRRSLSRQLVFAARERRLQQDYENYNNPPREGKLWICEFCEYESIFGKPPNALIRQYEIKDRRERKRMSEKRRLLDKAKMKSRKSKKGNKKGQNDTTAQCHQQQQTQDVHHDPQMMKPPFMKNECVQDDEYILDDYDDDSIQPT